MTWDGGHSRRSFLQNAALGLGGLSLATLGELTQGRAHASTRGKRRHLINIVVAEGWDSQWFHSAFPSPIVPADIRNTFKYTTRCTKMGLHPNHDGSAASPTNPDGTIRKYLGVGMLGDGVSLFNASDLSDLLIWRGLSVPGSHGAGNAILQHGTSAPYAMSYSTLVAAGLAATDSVRPLHYVQVSSSPEGLHTNTASATGYGIPNSIPDVSSLRTISSVGANDLLAVRRDAIDSTVRKLGDIALASRLKRKASKGLFETFLGSYVSTSSLMSAGIADDPEFLATWAQFCKNTVLAMQALLSDTKLEVCDPEGGPGSAPKGIDPITGESRARGTMEKFMTKQGILPIINNTVALATTHAASNINYLNAVNTTYKNLYTYSFGVALADFLIKKNLSAVVELPLPNPDGHDNNDQQLATNTLTFALYRELLRSLKSGTPGTNYLDMTTIVMHTEFDRQPDLSVATASLSLYPGTNHGDSASVLIAGAGVNTGSKGRILGDIKDAPTTYGNYPGLGSFDLGQSLPIDIHTGQVSASGQVVSTASLLPTVLAIFGFTVPDNQKNEHSLVPAVVKS